MNGWIYANRALISYQIIHWLIFINSYSIFFEKYSFQNTAKYMLNWSETNNKKHKWIVTEYYCSTQILSISNCHLLEYAAKFNWIQLIYRKLWWKETVKCCQKIYFKMNSLSWIAQLSEVKKILQWLS